MLDNLLDYFIEPDSYRLRSFINEAFNLFLLSIISLGIGYCAWLGIIDDDNELNNGKSPHSGFCPDFPNP